MKTSNLANLRDMRLPEFDKSYQIEEQKVHTFEGKCCYDIRGVHRKILEEKILSVCCQ